MCWIKPASFVGGLYIFNKNEKMEKKRKTYYYKVISKKRRLAGGFNEIAEVYYVKDNKIINIGEVKWNTAGYKGEKSCVYEFLFKKKFVTLKEYKDNKGYYYLTTSKIIIANL